MNVFATWSEDGTLDWLRTISDPAVEKDQSSRPFDSRAATKLFKTGLQDAPPKAEQASPWLNHYQQVIEEAVRQRIQRGVPSAELQRARSLFYRYGTEICAALLLAALPEAYATAFGAPVLVAAGQLRSNLVRRIRATAQFLVSVLAPDGDIDEAWDPDNGPAARTVINLRLFHHVTRTLLINGTAPESEIERLLGPKNCAPFKPLNQEDLIGTMLTFSITVFEVIERFGIIWDSADQQAYLSAWNFVGECLGIGDPAQLEAHSLLAAYRNFGPPHHEHLIRASTDVTSAAMLLEVLRRRQWLPIPPYRAPMEGLDPSMDMFEVLMQMDTIRGQTGAAAPATSNDFLDSLDGIWNSLRPGRILIGVLLSELNSFMPHSTQGLPLTVMRCLAPPDVCNRLGLGSGGLLEAGLLRLPGRRLTRDGADRTAANSIRGGSLRLMANYVTRRSIVGFLQGDPPFVIPALENWTIGIQSR